MFLLIAFDISLIRSDSAASCGARVQVKLNCFKLTPSKYRDAFGFTVFPRPVSTALLIFVGRFLLPRNATFLEISPMSGENRDDGFKPVPLSAPPAALIIFPSDRSPAPAN